MKTITMVAAVALTFFSASAAAQYFHGYACTQDCSGHEAGYRWAELHDITDPDDCSGNSQSFIEGCMAWAEENYMENQPECEDGGDCW